MSDVSPSPEKQDERGKISKPNLLKEWKENIRKKGELLRSVRNRAMVMINTYPQNFGVSLRRNDYSTCMTATTEFDVELNDGTKRFRLFLSVDMIHNGDLESGINIREVGKSDWDDDAISYRLDWDQGESTDKRFKDQTKDTTDDAQLNKILHLMAESTFERTEEGGISRLSDTYAETTITTEYALSILEKAKNFRRPRDTRITFGEFQEHITKYGKGNKILLLLE